MKKGLKCLSEILCTSTLVWNFYTYLMRSRYNNITMHTWYVPQVNWCQMLVFSGRRFISRNQEWEDKKICFDHLKKQPWEWLTWKSNSWKRNWVLLNESMTRKKKSWTWKRKDANPILTPNRWDCNSPTQLINNSTVE